jgi:hypothetical protein
MRYRKSLGNEYFTSFDDLQQAQNHYLRDNPQEDISQDIPTQELLETIIRNQEHIYERQDDVLQSLQQQRSDQYKVLSSFINAKYKGRFFSRFVIIALCGATLIPMCNRQKKMYEAFTQEQQAKADASIVLQAPDLPVDAGFDKNTYQFRGLPR